MEVKIIEPIGYCFGCKYAIEKALKIRKDNPNKNVFLFGQIVHNNEVSDFLSSNNIITIDTDNIENQREYLSRFTPDDFVIFSAHGHDESINEVLINSGVSFYDAICPKVRYNREVIKKESSTHDVIFIGKNKHPETMGCLSISPRVFLYDIHDEFDFSKINDESPLITNQTTLSFLELGDIHKKIVAKIPKARYIDKICDATLERQKNIYSLNDKDIDMFLVLGSSKSSNTKKLYEIASEKYPSITYQCSNLEDVKKLDFTNIKKVVITSGTSTSPEVIESIKNYLLEVK